MSDVKTRDELAQEALDLLERGHSRATFDGQRNDYLAAQVLATLALSAPVYR